MIKLILDKALEKCGLTGYKLAKRTGIQYQIINNYYKNKVKRYDGYRFCDAIVCQISDIIEYKK